MSVYFIFGGACIILFIWFTTARDVLWSVAGSIPSIWQQNGAILFQTSHCYQCELQGNLAANRLEHYERVNGMSAQWVTLDDALRHNRKVIAAQPASMGISIQRETCLLELVYASNQHLTGNSG